jgi:hypothetical protein
MRHVCVYNINVIVCAGAAGDTTTAELMRRRADEVVNGCRLDAYRGTMCSFMESKENKVAEALRWTAAASSEDGVDCKHSHFHCDGQRYCRLVAYEVLYVKYGVAKWPVDALHAVLSGKHIVFHLLQFNICYDL